MGPKIGTKAKATANKMVPRLRAAGFVSHRSEK